MTAAIHHEFGALISRLTRRENLSRKEAEQAFATVLNDSTTQMQQGAFLAALRTKGETEAEIAGAWDAIYQLDTVKIPLSPGLLPVENSGTGMDTFKTFNISTAAAVAAAARGICMARHGSRSITSSCGTVDMAEALGVDVECPAEMVARSIENAGIGLFNGMSATVHPGALGRILSMIHFGSTLNIAASLANPAMPATGLRGVYDREMILPVIRVMKAIGYQKAIVVHGAADGAAPEQTGMDEASVIGPTFCARLLESGEIETFTLYPQTYGLGKGDPGDLAPSGNMDTETRRFVRLMRNKENSLRKEAVMLNAALIFYAADMVSGIDDGLEIAANAMESGDALATLRAWVAAQNRDPETGLQTLEKWIE
ncbi:anthranilate phosphoribosyltransferase [Desulfosalsimonas propionicica]|uniref:Anthranilate phosphoribosyltransferase n=1 Tax=Desulfosalsimonas propionicica TaxID=332175 RepID=A0A7W0HLL1_9BACT|nr:anthranilate phosphoribosyltransferase [Desulfosalsimonas propionicica]